MSTQKSETTSPNVSELMKSALTIASETLQKERETILSSIDAIESNPKLAQENSERLERRIAKHEKHKSEWNKRLIARQSKVNTAVRRFEAFCSEREATHAKMRDRLATSGANLRSRLSEVDAKLSALEAEIKRLS